MNKAKPFDIPKREVWEAFKHVKANQGAAGVDGQSIQDFEADLADNLYKLWNRLSSGSYMPPPVRRVDIPKANGGTRPLGIPTVADRIAQEVRRRLCSPFWNRCSTRTPTGIGRGARRSMPSGRLAGGAGATTGCSTSTSRASSTASTGRCCSGRSASIRTVPWVLLYVERWLKAPAILEDGSLVPRTAGTPQGGVSARSANLFLHYAFDMWMGRTYPDMPFERYADDIICHCKSADEARALWSALVGRLTACKLALHPEKTKIVYCKDANRRGDFPNQSFDFLGFSVLQRHERSST